MNNILCRKDIMQTFQRLFSLTLLFLSFPTWAAVVYIGKERPAAVKFPADYDDSRNHPLVLLLHGYGSGADETVNYLEADLQQAASSFIYLVPEGTRDAEGRLHWKNALPQKKGEVNDSAYLQSLIAEVKGRWNIDSQRMYVVGISNGGFMAYRLACDTNGMFAGIVSIAGGMFSNTALCQSKTPISVLQIHGSKDEIVPFVSQNSATLGALESVQTWAQRNGCQNFEERSASRDLMLQPIIPGIVLADGAYKAPPGPVIMNDEGQRETDELLWSSCAQDTRVGLWRVNGGSHVPDYSGKNLLGQALDFLAAG
jgi:polyhydroxybutyrate depolymerase